MDGTPIDNQDKNPENVPSNNGEQGGEHPSFLEHMEHINRNDGENPGGDAKVENGGDNGQGSTNGDYSADLTGAQGRGGQVENRDGGLGDVQGQRVENRDDGFESENNPENLIRRQTEDLEVLFSFCDEKNTIEIVKSDDYGVLLENGISLLDLFNANALFDEQYYEDGYTKDEWRHYSGDAFERVSGKRFERDYARRERARKVLGLESRQPEPREILDSYDTISLEDLEPEDDLMRAEQAKRTIHEIATTYFGEGSSEEARVMLKDVIRTRADRQELSEDQKEFLKNESNITADRLLYDGHVLNPERASAIYNSLIDQLFSHETLDEGGRAELVRKMIYAHLSAKEFIEGGKAELVEDVENALATQTMLHLDEIISSGEENAAAYEYDYDVLDELVFNHALPTNLITTIREALEDPDRESYLHGYTYLDHLLDDPDLIVDYVGSKGLKMPRYSRYVRDLKKMGASDDAIMQNCKGRIGDPVLDNMDHFDFLERGDLHPGLDFIEAGVSRKAIIRGVFNTMPPFLAIGKESPVSTFEQNGFDITDIAKTFSPDMISWNLEEFIQRGADARELVRYMASYKEIPVANLTESEEGEVSDSMVRRSGIQTTKIWDENHPEGRMVRKFVMQGRGVDYVACNLEMLADSGVSEEDIIESVSGGDLSPNRSLVPKMLECRRFDAQKVVKLAQEKYFEHVKQMAENSAYDQAFATLASQPVYYYEKLLEQMSNENREERERYYQMIQP